MKVDRAFQPKLAYQIVIGSLVLPELADHHQAHRQLLAHGRQGANKVAQPFVAAHKAKEQQHRLILRKS